MNTNLSYNGYEIAQISKNEEDAIKKAENLIKEETGKDFVLIAWKKDEKLS